MRQTSACLRSCEHTHVKTIALWGTHKLAKSVSIDILYFDLEGCTCGVWIPNKCFQVQPLAPEQNTNDHQSRLLKFNREITITLISLHQHQLMHKELAIWMSTKSFCINTPVAAVSENLQMSSADLLISSVTHMQHTNVFLNMFQFKKVLSIPKLVSSCLKTYIVTSSVTCWYRLTGNWHQCITVAKMIPSLDPFFFFLHEGEHIFANKQLFE